MSQVLNDFKLKKTKYNAFKFSFNSAHVQNNLYAGMVSKQISHADLKAPLGMIWFLFRNKIKSDNTWIWQCKEECHKQDKLNMTTSQ